MATCLRRDMEMSVFINPYDNCPCNSGNKAKFCCLIGKRWNKKPTLLANKGATTNYSHDRCYANQHNQCTDKISKEHYISEYLLNNISNTNSVSIKGLNWQQLGTVQNISKSSLASNILCTHHNNLLSPFDSEMGRFHQKIISYNNGFDLECPVNEFSLFCGEDLEKWMLKTTCGFIASKQIGAGDRKVDCKMKEIYNDILFKDDNFPRGWGMYVDANSDQTITYHNYIDIKFLIQNDVILYAKINLAGLIFYLVLSKPNNIKPGMIYRPRGLQIRKGDTLKTIEICWQDTQYNKGVFLTHQRDITRTKDEWNEFIFRRV